MPAPQESELQCRNKINNETNGFNIKRVLVKNSFVFFENKK